jgi:hypothetical protein
VPVRVELRSAVIRAVALEGVFPDPKDLIDCVERINFEFVISVFASDKRFKIVVIVNLGVALSESRSDVGFFSGETEVKISVVPQNRHTRVKPCRLAGNDINETLRLGCHLPGWFIQLPVNFDWDGR